MVDSVGAGWSEPSYPHPLRPHQLRALEAIDDALAGGAQRAWVVLPPGAGKTVVGLEAARRLGRPTVILSPNTAIQGQWIAEWQRFTPALIPIGADRALSSPLTSLTYQALASFDPDAEVDEEGRTAGSARGGPSSLLDRLHPNGRALIDAMRAASPITLILDECHHLLEVWGRLIAELLEELAGETVIGLTGTPPESLSVSEAELVDELFGPPLYSVSIPSLVRDGYLAPFAELAWLARPTPAEADWLLSESERFSQLQTDLTASRTQGVAFLDWLDQRFVSRTIEIADGSHVIQQPEGSDVADDDALRLDWYELEHDQPELAAAALRFHHAGLLALPPGAVLREEHQHRPTAQDWVELIKDYVQSCLAPSDHESDRQLLERIRAALPGVGYQLTRRGIRRSRSPVDRVIARSTAKTAATVEILTAEAVDLGSELRALTLCDHERATATVPAGLRGVLDAQAGSARLLLATLLQDERTEGLAPLMITGRTVAAGPDTIARLAELAHDRYPELQLTAEPADDHAFVELRGNWTARRWVRLATRFFESGGTRALIGTRALLGEGWDAQRVNVLVDLTTATTPTAVVQTRGRSLRIDPAWPEKVAHSWSVVCVSEDHPGGAGDWARFVRKHHGYLAVTDSGEISVGVGHVDPGFSAYAPPAATEFDRSNASMLRRAEDRRRVRRLWQIGSPYQDQLVNAVRLKPDRAVGPLEAVDPDGSAPQPPTRLPGGADQPKIRHSALGSVIVSAVTVLAIIALLLTGQQWAPVLLLPAAAVVAWWLVRRRAADLAAGSLLAAWADEPDLISYGRAVADGLRSAGVADRGAEAVHTATDADGGYRITLADVPEEVSATFATALSELVGTIGTPRYVIPRYQPDRVVAEPPALRRAGRRWRSGLPLDRARVTYHAVPTLFGANRELLQHLVSGWRCWVSLGEPVRTSTAEGTGIMISSRGTRPIDATAGLRQIWQ